MNLVGKERGHQVAEQKREDCTMRSFGRLCHRWGAAESFPARPWPNQKIRLTFLAAQHPGYGSGFPKGCPQRGR